MKIGHISDWHTDVWHVRSMRDKLYDEDVEILLITGDMLPDYKLSPDRQRREWEHCAEAYLEIWPNASMFAVPGNHDFCNYNIPGIVHSFDKAEPGKNSVKIHGYTISGFRGVPWHTGFWHGECSDRLLDAMIGELDIGADIVLTHAPPYGILDAVGFRNIGIMRLEEWFINHPWHRNRLHAFGHCHEEGGKKFIRNNVWYSNAAGAVNYINL